MVVVDPDGRVHPCGVILVETDIRGWWGEQAYAVQEGYDVGYVIVRRYQGDVAVDESPRYPGAIRVRVWP